MSSNNSSGRGNFLDSATDALSPGNVGLKLLQFFIFGLLTATPYVIQNLNGVAGKVAESGATGFMVVIAYLQALAGAMWIGLGLGLSTVFQTVIHLSDVIVGRQIGTLLFSIMILAFAILMFYQPIRLLFNIFDMKKGREHSRALIVVISFVFVLIIASPVASLVMGGETITSGLEEKSGGDEIVGDVPLNESVEVIGGDDLEVNLVDL